MTRFLGSMRRGVTLGLILTAAGALGGACAGEEDAGPPNNRRPTGAGGSSNSDASAGASGNSGTTGFGGSSGMSGAAGTSSGTSGASGTGGGGTGGTGEAGPCPGPSSVPVDGFPLCPDNVRCVTVAGSAADAGAPDGGDGGPSGQQVCVAARCVPSAAIPSPDQVALLPDCPDPNTKCVPEPFIATLGQFLAKECRSLIDAEGRCIPVLLPAVRSQVDRLPQADCAADERCAPCYDPLTGAATGACTAGCGPGPDEQPKTFATCCNGIGSCVPPSLAGSDASRLGRETCAESFLCAPKAFSDAAYVPATCRSVGDAEGRCLPSCLPEIAAQASLLPRSTCAEHHLCAPCYDPLKSTPTVPASTGACNRGTDTPKEPPKIFPNCCGDIGVCVPTSAVPAAQQGQLGRDNCTGTDVLCAPRFLTDPAAKAAKCRSLDDSEGRCLPACLPAVASQPGLPVSTCQTGFLCAPCYNPVTSAVSGACGINGDMPTEQPKPFPRCCTGGSGACVPLSLIPDAQESLLGRDSCTDTGRLCVPTELADSSFKPPECNSLGGGEGRCLAPCIPSIAAQASRLPQSTCPTNRVCAPCYDPTITPATPSGACSINGDAPKRTPPYTFPKCCAYQGTTRGTCIPLSVAGSVANGLPQDTCPGPDAGADAVKCVPDQKVRDQNYRFPSCQAAACVLGICAPRVPGACVPDCIPDATQKAFIDRNTCAVGELCAPCEFPPGSGTRTGACD